MQPEEIITMALFSTPQEHADNAPATWQVVKAGPRLWHLTTKSGTVLTSEQTKRAAEQERTEGFYVDLYEKERRWYAGESVRGWKPYAVIQREREVREILAARRKGADCTEDGSATLKGYLREAPAGDRLAQKIADLFPVEADEVAQETQAA